MALIIHTACINYKQRTVANTFGKHADNIRSVCRIRNVTNVKVDDTHGYKVVFILLISTCNYYRMYMVGRPGI